MLNLLMSMNTAMKAMQVFSYAVATTTHNVANSTDPSYSRQLADITASTPLSIVGGQIGTGSQLAGVERIRDTYLDTQIMEMENNVGNESILNRTYQNLAAIFPEVDGVTSGLQAQITQFFSDYQNLATQAQAGSAAGILNAQNAIYQDAATLSQSFNAKAVSLSNMRTDLSTDLSNDIDKANGYINQIYTLNGEIKQVYATGESPNDLLDQRTAAMTSLSELINFTTQTGTDGTVTLILNGTPLVSGATGYNLLNTIVPVLPKAAVPPAMTDDTVLLQDPSQPLVGLQMGVGRGTVIPTSAITGGEIAGILNSRDNVVPYYQNKLDETANSLITVINQIETAGDTPQSALFTGTDAENMGVNTSKLASTVAYSSNFTGAGASSNDIASIIGGLGNKLISTFTFTSNIGLNSNQAIGASGIITINSSITVNYLATDTVGSLIKKINAAGGGSVSAVYNSVNKQIWLYGSQGLSITDTGFLLQKWNMSEQQWSAANVNYPYVNVPAGTLTSTWLSQQYNLNMQPTAGGEVGVISGGIEVDTPWSNLNKIASSASTIMTQAFPGLPGPFTGTGGTVTGNNSKIEVGNNESSSTNINVVTPFQLVDLSGNFTTALNLVGNVDFNDIYQSTIDKLAGDTSTASSMFSQYQSSLTQLQTMQQQVTQVNVDNEEAQAELYQRGYDASVRLENVIDQMLNTLINDTGTPSNSTTTSL